MSNERIDLTQFEGITKGKWVADFEPAGECWIVESSSPSRLQTVGQYLYEGDANAIAKLPDLIAELKNCYKLLDAAEETYESIGICLYCDACETKHESDCKFASE